MQTHATSSIVEFRKIANHCRDLAVNLIAEQCAQRRGTAPGGSKIATFLLIISPLYLPLQRKQNAPRCAWKINLEKLPSVRI